MTLTLSEKPAPSEQQEACENGTGDQTPTSNGNGRPNDIKRSDSDNVMTNAKGCSLQSTKYVSLKERIEKRIAENDRWYSLEFFPPTTASGAENLIGW